MTRHLRYVGKGAGGMLFRGAELPRLGGAILMLAVLYLMIQSARQPETWKWLANDQKADGLTAVQIEALDGKPPSPAVIASGPTDRDAAEIAAAKKDFEFVTDKRPLEAEDMRTYWRLLQWTARQTPQAMAERSRRDLLFTHLMQAPAKYRGELVHLRLHVKRTLTYETDPKLGAPPNFARLYEAWGVTDESGTNPYCAVFADLPEGMLIGPNVWAEAAFDGYFVKLMAIQSVDDKVRVAPLLVGRMNLISNTQPTASVNQWSPGAFWAFAAFGLFLLIRWTLPLWRRSSSAESTAEAPVSGDQWLEKLEKAPLQAEASVEKLTAPPAGNPFDERH